MILAKVKNKYELFSIFLVLLGSCNSKKESNSPDTLSASRGFALSSSEFSALNVSNNLYEIHVSPSGADTNQGTVKAPVQSLVAAQNIERQILAKFPASSVHVLVGEGFYEVSSPIAFDESDSGRSATEKTQWIGLSGNGQQAVISMGRRLSTKPKYLYTNDQNLKFYSVAIGNDKFMQVFFGNKKGLRARSPNPNVVLPVLNPQSLDSYAVGASLLVPSSGWQAWGVEYAGQCGKLMDTEIVLKKTWAPAYHKIAALSRLGNGSDKITLSPEVAEPEFCLSGTVKKSACNLSANTFYGPFYHSDSSGNQKQPYYFENSPCFVDLEGEWFADFAYKEMIFIPPSGFNPESDPIYISKGSSDGQGENIINIGTSSSRAKNINFSNLSFAYANWNYPVNHSLFVWAGADFITGFNSSRNIIMRQMPGAISILNAENITIQKSEFYGLGGDGITIKGQSSSNITIESSKFHDIAGLSIDAPAYIAHDGITIQNSVFENNGFEYGGGGINITGSKNVNIQHNSLNNISGGGVSLSGVQEGLNSITSNKLSNVALEYGDAGGIYTNSTEKSGSTKHHIFISENVIQNQKAPSIFVDPSSIASFRSNGIYLDFSSSWTAVSKNIIRNVPIGFGINCAHGNAIFNNRVENTSVSLYNRGCAGITDSMVAVESDYVSTSGQYENSATVLSASEIARIEENAGPKTAGSVTTKCVVNVIYCWKGVIALGNNVDGFDGAGSNMNRCLLRASDYAHWCGNNALGRVVPNYSATASFFEGNVLKGSKSAHADGCLISSLTCRNGVVGSKGPSYFYDNMNNAASNLSACANRAQEYHSWCGNVAGDIVRSQSIRAGEYVQTNVSH